ncbi:MAG: ParB N-terminal domain-containing protein [Leptospirales bacterium]|jgi:hypothetical protein
MARKSTRKKAAAIAAPALRNRILKYGEVDWRKCKWLQPDTLKKQSPAQRSRLRESMLQNGFAAPFFVWQSGKTTYIVDGHHRQPILEGIDKEGIEVPAKLPAIWIAADDAKEARKLVLVYSSKYADFEQKSLTDFLSEFDPDEILNEIDIPGMDLAKPPADPEDDPEPEYPIVPEYSEDYNGVVIFVDNEIDWTHLCELLELEMMKSYKTSKIGMTRVIRFKDFIKRIGKVRK